MNTKGILAINHVDVLTMTENRILSNRLVVIESGRILSVSEAVENTGYFQNAIDGRGKTLMPGLINMHTHLGDNPDDLALYLANGITAIRNMWGYEGFRPGQWLMGTRVFHHLRLKRDIDEGRITGPSVFTAGPLIDGAPPFFPRFMCLQVVDGRSGVERVIKEQAGKGYDFIKIYSRLSPQSFEDIIEAAGHFGMPVAGHVPDAVGLRRALEAKIHSVEHLYGFVNPYNPALNLRQDEIRELAALSAANGVWHCPTLVANDRITNMKNRDEYEREEQMRYIPGRNRRMMRLLSDASGKLMGKSFSGGNRAYMDVLYGIVRLLKSEGAGILLGTDKTAPYVVAGFSEHIEMTLLSQAGLTNYEVLRAATSDAAKCLKREAEMGTIEPGKRANLILTDTNPLEDLVTLRRPAGVFKDGIYYSRQQCDAMLQKAQKSR